MPWRTTRTARLASAQKRSWRSARRSSSLGRGLGRVVLVQPCVAPGSTSTEADARAGLDAKRVAQVGHGRIVGTAEVPPTRRERVVDTIRATTLAPTRSPAAMTIVAHQAASDLPRRPLGRVARRRSRSPTRPTPPTPAGATYTRDRGPVRGGGRGGRRGVRGHAHAARLRARPDPARDQRRDQGAPRGARPADRARGRQADPRRAGRGRPGHPDLPARRRGGGADDRRAHPARPAAVVEGPGRHHAALPDRPDRRDQPVQLPAQPGRAQARAGHRDAATRSCSSRRPRTR